MADKLLVSGLFLYVLTIIFIFFQLPGTVELAVFSIPTVSLLLFRYFRVNFKGEPNLYVKFFTLFLSFFISLTLLTPLIYLKNTPIEKIEFILLLGWITLILLNLFYYSYYFLKSKVKENRFGYLIIVMTGLLFLIEASISYSLNAEYFELKIITCIAFSILAMYIFIEVIRKKPIPKISIGYTLLIGAIFTYSVDIFLLLINN